MNGKRTRGVHGYMIDSKPVETYPIRWVLGRFQ